MPDVNMTLDEHDTAQLIAALQARITMLQPLAAQESNTHKRIHAELARDQCQLLLARLQETEKYATARPGRGELR